MSRKTPSDATSPELIKATNKGRVDMQTKRDAQQPYKDNFSDQSEGAKAEGQPTAMHGRGAGFSRNAH